MLIKFYFINILSPHVSPDATTNAISETWKWMLKYFSSLEKYVWKIFKYYVNSTFIKQNLASSWLQTTLKIQNKKAR